MRPTKGGGGVALAAAITAVMLVVLVAKGSVLYHSVGYSFSVLVPSGWDHVEQEWIGVPPAIDGISFETPARDDNAHVTIALDRTSSGDDLARVTLEEAVSFAEGVGGSATGIEPTTRQLGGHAADCARFHQELPAMGRLERIELLVCTANLPPGILIAAFQAKPESFEQLLPQAEQMFDSIRIPA
ncbi:MAG: hypothetical protein WD206_05655 [Actinomycetota bacterium]